MKMFYKYRNIIIVFIFTIVAVLASLESVEI